MQVSPAKNRQLARERQDLTRQYHIAPLFGTAQVSRIIIMIILVKSSAPYAEQAFFVLVEVSIWGFNRKRPKGGV
jgi:hypothetical protein